jgi:hypothetical protein
MPIKRRHVIRKFGAVLSSNETVPVDVTNGTRGLLHLAAAANTFAIHQCSPDGGATWFNQRTQTGALKTYGVGAAGESRCFQLNHHAGLVRFFIGSGDAESVDLETVREIK